MNEEISKTGLYESCKRAFRDATTTEFCASAEDNFNLDCVIAAKRYLSTTVGSDAFSERGMLLLDKLEEYADYL